MHILYFVLFTLCLISEIEHLRKRKIEEQGFVFPLVRTRPDLFEAELERLIREKKLCGKKPYTLSRFIRQYIGRDCTVSIQLVTNDKTTTTTMVGGVTVT